ncbi:MAG: hypothetical protein LH616_05640, partial [Ilumatobacteraceae bacterium]|nr:hypothetical protein [Ilumatobacteraceae bacterium]
MERRGVSAEWSVSAHPRHPTCHQLSAGDSATDDAQDAAGFDAGPPAWTSTLAAGTLTIVASAGDPLCTFELLSVAAGGPPTYTMYLRKRDASGGVCNEPKGLRALGTGYSD